MTRITEKPPIDALAANDLLYVRDASDPANPDKKVTGQQVLDFAASLSLAPEATPADNDRVPLHDVSDPAIPRKFLPWSKFRPAGAKITDYIRAVGYSITIPTLAAGAELDGLLSVPGAAIGDHVIFNMSVPANIAILGTVVFPANTISVRFRNTHASTTFMTANVPCVVLVIRSAP